MSLLCLQSNLIRTVSASRTEMPKVCIRSECKAARAARWKLPSGASAAASGNAESSTSSFRSRADSFSFQVFPPLSLSFAPLLCYECVAPIGRDERLFSDCIYPSIVVLRRAPVVLGPAPKFPAQMFQLSTKREMDPSFDKIHS